MSRSCRALQSQIDDQMRQSVHARRPTISLLLAPSSSRTRVTLSPAFVRQALRKSCPRETAAVSRTVRSGPAAPRTLRAARFACVVVLARLRQRVFASRCAAHLLPYRHAATAVESVWFNDPHHHRPQVHAAPRAARGVSRAGGRIACGPGRNRLGRGEIHPSSTRRTVSVTFSDKLH